MTTSNHLVFKREQVVNEKRGHPFPPPKKDLNLPQHGRRLLSSLASAKEHHSHQINGYDGRLLFKIEVDDFRGNDLETIPSVEIISQENKGIFLVFSSEEGLEAFEANMRDKESETARLVEQVQTLLRVREQARATVRS